MKYYKVLVVDDEPIIREGLRKHIDWENMGLTVVGTADSAESALQLAEYESPDILITDICMGGKDGLNLVEDLLERSIYPQVILISSYNEFSYAQRAVRLSVVREYILKPIDIIQLSSLLRHIRIDLEKQTSSLSLTTEAISVSHYHAFLRGIRSNGYDRYQLATHLKSGDSKNAMALWEKAEEGLRSPSTSTAIVKRFSSSLLLSLIADGIIGEEDSTPDDPIKLLESCHSKEEIIEYLSQLLLNKGLEATRHRLSPRSKLIEQSLIIIEREYCNPNFNLTVLAAQLNVAPNYLSSRFKEETGTGFMKYRLEKQMEQAKLLLSNPIYKIYSISSMVGFTDEKYFSRQFKRYTGNSPKDYRNNCTS